jgi:hypothetical protein
MREIQDLLKRQAEWQKGRRQLSWPEKIRMVEAVRESLLQLRGSTSRPTTSHPEGEAPLTVHESE